MVTLSVVPVGVLCNGRFVRATGPSIISLVLVVFISMSFSLARVRSFVRKVGMSVFVCLDSSSVRVVSSSTLL